MSIIAEALKKAKDRTGNKETFKIPLYNVASPDAKTKSTPNKKKALGLFLILPMFFGGLLLISYFWYSTVTHAPIALTTNGKAPATKEAAPEQTYAKKEIPPEQESISIPIPVTISQVNSSLQLSGIMYTPKRPLAVINNSIWAVGDTVDDFKIIEINKTSVKVADESQEFVLKLKR